MFPQRLEYYKHMSSTLTRIEVTYLRSKQYYCPKFCDRIVTKQLRANIFHYYHFNTNRNEDFCVLLLEIIVLSSPFL